MRFSNETLGSTKKTDNIRLPQWGQTEVQVPAEPARSNKQESGVSSEQALRPEAGTAHTPPPSSKCRPTAGWTAVWTGFVYTGSSRDPPGEWKRLQTQVGPDRLPSVLVLRDAWQFPCSNSVQRRMTTVALTMGLLSPGWWL